ncbi:MAG: CoA transferase [Dehalococcoidia bacterium]
MSEPVLKGVRVLEVGAGISVAFAAKWLAGFGADVVRSELPSGNSQGPAYLSHQPLTADEEVYLLAGKRRVSADADLEALALAADIVIEGDQPPSFSHDRKRLDVEPLRAKKPELVVVSITPYGQDGPSSHSASTNITSFASGGIMSLTGMAQREPLVTGGSQAFYLAGLNGFGAAVTAYLGSLIHGEGDWVDISAQECMAGMLELYGPGGAVSGVPSVRAGNHVRASWGIYPCADGFAGVCALERQIPAFFSVVGDPELDEPRFRDRLQRPDHDDELQAKFYGWFAEHTKQEILDLGAKYKVPFGAVMTPKDLLSNASLDERGFFDAVTTQGGNAMVPGRPFLGLPWVPGELHEPEADTAEVNAEWLGVPA